MNINYRSAVPSDIIDLITLVEEYCDEAGFKHDLPSIKKYIDFQLGKLPTIIAAEGDKVVGAMSYAIMNNPFKQDELWGRKIAAFVSKDYREQGVGTTLREYAEQDAKAAGATRFYFTAVERPSEDYLAFEMEWTKILGGVTSVPEQK